MRHMTKITATHASKTSDASDVTLRCLIACSEILAALARQRTANGVW
jgi:hypothetical protein